MDQSPELERKGHSYCFLTCFGAQSDSCTTNRLSCAAQLAASSGYVRQPNCSVGSTRWWDLRQGERGQR